MLNVTRRSFVTTALAGVALPQFTAGADTSIPATAKGASAEALARVKSAAEAFAQVKDAAFAAEGKPYFHLRIPTTGEQFTFERPPDHNWHLGLWFSWKFINGCCFWEPDKKAAIRLRSYAVDKLPNTADGGQVTRFTVESDYLAKGTPIMHEHRVITRTLSANGNVVYDWSTTVHALTDLTFNAAKPGQDKKTKYYVGGGYTGLHVRMQPKGFTFAFENDTGKKGQACCGVASKTVTVHVTSQKTRARCRLTLTADTPTPNFIRDFPGKSIHTKGGYYIAGFSELFFQPRTLAKGKSWTLHHVVTCQSE